MKLVRCYIENYGTLSHYSYEFTDGLNVIQKPNGFGKSTLASFLRAMLYGFPSGKRERSIDQNANERKRYLPWQAGRYGGWLEFEHEGKIYRVNRTFGKAASGDKFSLNEMPGGKESHRFSERLGEELFQLDSESFMRSIYLPQLMKDGGLSTLSIQTKLSDLVENTDDLNNFDKACERLKKTRTNYKHLTGTGGRVGELQAGIRTLETELEKAAESQKQLPALRDAVDRLERERDQKAAVLKAQREKIALASAQLAHRTLKKSSEEMKEEAARTEQELAALDARYPAGYPTPALLSRQRENVHTIRQEERILEELVLRPEDEERTQAGETLFADRNQVEADIDQCQRDCTALRVAEQKARTDMTQEEREHRETLLARFAQGAPEAHQMEAAQVDITSLHTKRELLSKSAPDADDLAELAALDAFFGGDLPDQALLDQCDQCQRQLEEMEKDRRLCCLAQEDETRLADLGRTFANGVPAEDEIRRWQQAGHRIAALSEKVNARPPVPPQPQHAAKNSKMPLLCAIAGAVLILAGLGCFALSRFATGAILAVLGFGAVACALWLNTQQTIERKTAARAVDSVSREELDELESLRRGVADFLTLYGKSISDADQSLNQLLVDRQQYLELCHRREQLTQQDTELGQHIDHLRQSVQKITGRWYPETEYRAEMLTQLRQKSARYALLSASITTKQAQCDGLRAQIEEIEARLRDFFAPWCGPVTLENPQTLLDQLSADARTYQSLQAKWETTQAARLAAQKDADALNVSIRSVLEKYHVFSEQATPEAGLSALRKEASAYWEAAHRVEQWNRQQTAHELNLETARQALADFLRQYQLDDSDPAATIEKAAADLSAREILLKKQAEGKQKQAAFAQDNPDFDPAAMEGMEQLPAPEVLMIAEKQAQQALTEAEDQHKAAMDRFERCRQEAERVPELEDQRVCLTEEKADCEHRVALLDRTMELLKTAKENLANSYVGKVRTGFDAYAARLLGQSFGEMTVGAGLEVQVDQQGELRPLNCFSAGTVDSVRLCMRLALIDALFEDEKPFIILDDPFINLDDEHTACALQMLAELAKTHQILYLVCNSSRA